ncbi:MAG: DUF4013 domain-containing protein [Anaerolineae bacterium]|nr:DUF4013 domain-containing protein [Anaerolineae bacterium]
MESLQYPFRGQGAFGKIVTAGLLMMIPLVNLFGAFVLVGYGIKIIGSVLAGDENLPEFDIMQDFGRGLIGLVAAIVYMIPVIIISVVLGVLFGNGSGGMNGIGALLYLLTIPLSFALSLAVLVAFSRFAVEGESGVLFAFTENFQLAFGNLGAGLEFFVNAILFGIILGVLVGIGFVLLIIPGLVIAIAGQFAQYHLAAQYAQRLGIGGKAKRKMEEYSF